MRGWRHAHDTKEKTRINDTPLTWEGNGKGGEDCTLTFFLVFSIKVVHHLWANDVAKLCSKADFHILY